MARALPPDGELVTLEIDAHHADVARKNLERAGVSDQVRIMVGTLTLVGKGKWRPEDVKTALEAADRAKAGPTAPPDGLYLRKVDY